MKIKLLSLLILLFSIKAFSQSDYVMGNISNENGDKLPNTSIVNLRTDQVVISDFMGNFVIAAKASDELRIARQGYERKNVTLNSENFSKSLDVKLSIIPVEIEEVKIAFRPTGILRKDVARLNPPPKVVALNSAMNLYMKTPPNGVTPTATVPSSFRQPNFSAGQLDMMKLGSAIGGLIGKATQSPKTTANYSEKQEFYKRVKAVVNLDYYTSYGLDEYDFDIFLAYADESQGLSKNYRNNFNKVAIESQLKVAFAEYIKTHNFSKKVSEG
ncbi:hypothetical protein [Epilithonimonas sp. UC225_85]|uniref:hypothetical protein n=1 Tax=Epilithonimonas sp. UC225_85 TaxID=3350167 RepID=UPI0036D3CD2F